MMLKLRFSNIAMNTVRHHKILAAVIIIGFAMAFCSCVPEDYPTAFASISLGVGTDGDGTRSPSTFSEALPCETVVNSVVYAIFDSRGWCDAIIPAGQGGRVSAAEIAVGTKTIIAVVNSPYSLYSSFSTVEEFENVVVDLTDNDLSGSEGFVMYGKIEAEIYSGEQSIEIPVRRLCSKISLVSVENALDRPFASDNLVLLRWFLSNVPGKITVGGIPYGLQDGANWYAKFGRRDGGGEDDVIASASDCKAGDWIFGASLSGYSIAPGEIYEPEDRYMYCYPNPTEEDAHGYSGLWTPRYTRLVVEAGIRGYTYYYPVCLTGLSPNHAYAVVLRITRPGTLDPDTEDYSPVQPIAVYVEEDEDGGTIMITY